MFEITVTEWDSEVLRDKVGMTGGNARVHLKLVLVNS